MTDRQMNTQTDEIFDTKIHRSFKKIHRPESCKVVIQLGPTAGFTESAKAFQLPGLPERAICWVCKSVPSAGSARACYLPGLPERVICRVCQSVSSAGSARACHLLDLPERAICRVC